MSTRIRKGHLEYHTWKFPQTKRICKQVELKLNKVFTCLLRWGFRFTISNSSNEHAIITMTRSCKILNLCLNLDHMIEFAEHCFRISSSSLTLSPFILPPIVTRLLESRACRGAIMFGDKVSLCDASSLISQLSHCRLPFQCAHGRPSVQVLSAFRRKSSSVMILEEGKKKMNHLRSGSIMKKIFAINAEKV